MKGDIAILEEAAKAQKAIAKKQWEFAGKQKMIEGIPREPRTLLKNEPVMAPCNTREPELATPYSAVAAQDLFNIFTKPTT